MIGDVILYEDNTPAGNMRFVLLISPSGSPGRSEEVLTNEHGVFKYNLRFDEDHCDVTIQGGGFSKHLSHLLGPEYNPKMTMQIPDDLPDDPAEIRRQARQDAQRDLANRRHPAR